MKLPLRCVCAIAGCVLAGQTVAMVSAQSRPSDHPLLSVADFQPNDPEEGTQAATPGDGLVRTPMPTREFEGVTVFARNGDRLTVETTRPLPNGSTQTTTTTYRR